MCSSDLLNYKSSIIPLILINFSYTFCSSSLANCRLEVLSSLQLLGDKREVDVHFARILLSDLIRIERVFCKYLHIYQGCERQRGEQSSAETMDACCGM